MTEKQVDFCIRIDFTLSGSRQMSARIVHFGITSLLTTMFGAGLRYAHFVSAPRGAFKSLSLLGVYPGEYTAALAYAMNSGRLLPVLRYRRDALTRADGIRKE